MTPATPLTHRETWELIPWVVNGTATPNERQDVERHLRDCADCRDEYALQMQFHAGMNAGGDIERDAQPSLRRLLARIDTPEEQALSADAAPPARARWPQWLAAAVVVQAIGLALLGGAQLKQAGAPDAGYRTLTNAPAASAAAIRLVPSPQLSLTELSQLLAAQQLRVVEANADATILGVAPTHETADVDAIVARLRATPGVLLAEPVAGAAHAPR